MLTDAKTCPKQKVKAGRQGDQNRDFAEEEKEFLHVLSIWSAGGCGYEIKWRGAMIEGGEIGLNWVTETPPDVKIARTKSESSQKRAKLEISQLERNILTSGKHSTGMWSIWDLEDMVVWEEERGFFTSCVNHGNDVCVCVCVQKYWTYTHIFYNSRKVGLRKLIIIVKGVRSFITIGAVSSHC